MEFKNVTAVAKANVYFDGKVVSHTILTADGAKKTVGLIYAGTYHFGTDKAEIMEITDGTLRVVQAAHLRPHDGRRRIRLHGPGGREASPHPRGCVGGEPLGP